MSRTGYVFLALRSQEHDEALGVPAAHPYRKIWRAPLGQYIGAQSRTKNATSLSS